MFKKLKIRVLIGVLHIIYYYHLSEGWRLHMKITRFMGVKLRNLVFREASQ